MKFRLVLVMGVIGISSAFAQGDGDDVDMGPGAVPAQPSCFNDKVRISALISSGEKVRVGIVDTISKTSYLVSPGESAGQVVVVAADYDRETVTLRLGDEVCTLNLSSDPNADHSAQNLLPPTEKVDRGEAIEAFLKENPNAVEQGMIKFPLPIMPNAVGKGEGIEKFLRDNPELAAKADQPVVGKGEGIEKFLREHPEIKVDEEIPEGSFGSGIDAELKKHPEFLTNSVPGIPPALQK